MIGVAMSDQSGLVRASEWRSDAGQVTAMIYGPFQNCSSPLKNVMNCLLCHEPNNGTENIDCLSYRPIIQTIAPIGVPKKLIVSQLPGRRRKIFSEASGRMAVLFVLFLGPSRGDINPDHRHP
jgi:hypothetical protein